MIRWDNDEGVRHAKPCSRRDAILVRLLDHRVVALIRVVGGHPGRPLGFYRDFLPLMPEFGSNASRRFLGVAEWCQQFGG